ncbi:MAG: methylthioribulose 1-phosphate dehydratase [Gammaproteobacteria bacterium]|nr:methylthioribulose 1-phosphate dehydratase [Gammaproteobacteria bacterium]
MNLTNSTVAEATNGLIAAAQFIAAKGWCPATGGNFSQRLNDKTALMTASGRDKAALSAADFLTVDWQGQALGSELKPSAETLLHTNLYQLDATIGAVLHTHSVAATVLSVMSGSGLKLHDLEMLKSLQGITTHETEVCIPIFNNHQDMTVLARQLRQQWTKKPIAWGFLVRGHGLYSFGSTMAEARRHMEGLEFLMQCELTLRQLGHAVQAPATDR